MNQLEFFVASTECARSEIRRYLRQLRELDELIEYHLDCLRYITEQRVAQRATGEAEDASSPANARGSTSRGSPAEPPAAGSSRRRQASPAKAVPTAGVRRGRAEAGEGAPPVPGPELLAALARGTPSSVRSGLLDPASLRLTGLPAWEMRAAYTLHRTRAMRHAEERRIVAAELAERSGELRGAMAVRLAQFEQGVEGGVGR